MTIKVFRFKVVEFLRLANDIVYKNHIIKDARK